MDEPQTVAYLSRAAACLPPSGDISKLRSHLLWVSSSINQTGMCPKCCHAWNDGKFTLMLKPSGTPGPRMIKIIRKFLNTPTKLNAVERSLLDRFNKNIRNKLVLTCLACKAETVTQIKKHEKPQLQNYIRTPVISLDIPVPNKKKKKKDRFAGLKVSAVLSSTPSTGPKSLSKPKNAVSSQTSAAESVKQQQNAVPNSTKSPSAPGGTFKEKLKIMREEVKQTAQKKVHAEKKTLSQKNSKVKMSGKMQNFLKRAQKDVKLEDRINSLLQN